MNYFIRRLGSLNCFVFCPFDAICDHYDVPSMNVNESPRSHQLIKLIYLTLFQGNIENVIHAKIALSFTYTYYTRGTSVCFTLVF